MARILVTGVGGPAGTAVAGLLAERGHTVIGVDMNPPAELASCAVLESVPAASDLDLVPALRSLVTRHQIDLFIPTVQDELPAVAAARRLIGCPVVISTADAVTLAHDKFLTAAALADAGVPVPATVAPRADDDVRGLASQVGLPYVVKPRVSRGGRGVVVIDTADQDETIPDGSIAQAFAPGVEYAAQLYIGTDGIDVVLLEKTALKQGRVGNAAAVVRRERGSVPDAEAAAAGAALALGLVGPVDMDIRRLEDGTPVVLEINARFGANCARVPDLMDSLLAEWLGEGPGEAGSAGIAHLSNQYEGTTL